MHPNVKYFSFKKKNLNKISHKVIPFHLTILSPIKHDWNAYRILFLFCSWQWYQKKTSQNGVAMSQSVIELVDVEHDVMTFQTNTIEKKKKEWSWKRDRMRAHFKVQFGVSPCSFWKSKSGNLFLFCERVKLSHHSYFFFVMRILFVVSIQCQNKTRSASLFSFISYSHVTWLLATTIKHTS